MNLDKINVFKIKPHMAVFDDFLKGNDFEEIVLPDLDVAVDVEVRAAFKTSGGKSKTENDIPWLRFINSGFQQPQFTYSATNMFPAALLAVKLTENERNTFFALSFGMGGESFLDRESIIKDFGIKVAMNMCDPEKLKRVQTSVHESITTQTERQVSAGAEITEFHLNSEREFLRTIAGLAKNEYQYVASFKGKESISIKFKKDDDFSWQKLIDTILELNTLSKDETYKRIFRSYDNLVLETDNSIIEVLDTALFEKIKDNKLDHIHMAPPEFFDFDRYTFKYLDKDDEPDYDDLQTENLLNRRRAISERGSIKTIKNWRIYIQDADTGHRFNKWSAYQCLVAEETYDGAIYILSNGCWKRVDPDFHEMVVEYVKTVEATEIATLPENISICRLNEEGKKHNREEFYNSDAVIASPDLFLFDKAKIEIAGEKRYEVCDILHREKKFIHVKRYYKGCSSISHLFVQTRFYADAFLSDIKCRQGMRAHIEACEHEANYQKDTAAFVNIIPEVRTDIAEKDYEVVYCILSSKDDFTVDDLPFMAKYELMLSHQYLTTNRGFQCSLLIRKVTVDDAVQVEEGDAQ